MLLCRRFFLLHRGMGECESPMSCLIICLVAVIIPRFTRFDKYFLHYKKLFLLGNSPALRRKDAERGCAMRDMEIRDSAFR